MKATGVVRKVDDLGRIVIPKELRRNLNIEIKDPLEIFVNGDTIVLKKYKSVDSCIFCDNVGGTTYKGKIICSSCISDLHATS